MPQPLPAEPETLPPEYVPPPRGEDLPCDDGEPMETARHRDQMTLLISSLRQHWADRDDFYAGGNMFLYYSALQAKRNDFRGPDVFVVLGTDQRERRSWVVWEEDGKAPDVVIELTSDSTREVDRGDKMRIYGRVIGVAEYFIYDPWTGELEGFRLTGGEYVPIRPGEGGRLDSSALGLQLGVRQGVHGGADAPWLRWHTAEGELVPTPEEGAAEAKSEAAEAKSEAAEAKSEAEAAAARAAGLESRLAAYEARFGALDGGG